MDAAVLPQRNLARRARYRPPASWQKVRLDDLLRLTGVAASPTQLDLLAPDGRRGEMLDLFVAGNVDLLSRPRVSVVGTRQVSPEGASRARRLARELAAHGVVVVSGLAEGVDTNAMRAAISAGGNTIGVIGTPLNKAYPAANADLQEEVYRDHLLISQFAQGERVHRSNFPQRNRLMAALSDATVVVEASDTSGTLHQAAECVRLNRWLFIAKSVVDDPEMSWPAKFRGYEKCRVLTQTSEIVAVAFA